MRITRNTNHQVFATLAAMAMAGGALQAGETSPATAPAPTTGAEQSLYDKIWALPTLYKNENNPVLQEFSLQGRLQLQYAAGDSGQGDFSSGDLPDTATWGDIDVRRWLLGMKSKWFNVFKLEGQINVNPEIDPFYNSIYDLYLTYAPSDQFNLSAGKQQVKFSKEQEISSKEILTIERSLLSNQLFPGELTGVWMSGKEVAGHWFYELGAYGNDLQKEFSDFNAGAIILGKAGYDFAERLSLERATLGLHYLGNTDAGAAGSKPYDHCFSLTGDAQQGRWGFTSDVMYGTGENVADVFGVSLIPSVYVAEGLQLVARYQFATADGNDGLRVQSRYERLAPDLTDGGRGDSYQAGYLGLNYYLYGHKLKLMTGVEYANMSGEADGGDYDGWTGFAGMRMYF